LQARLDLCLESGDSRYDDSRFYVIDWTSQAAKQGYTGKLDELGAPVDAEAYKAWLASLPRVWLTDRVFHHHMVYVAPDADIEAAVESAIALHLPNFGKAWRDGADADPGGMRHGWDVAARIRPMRYDVVQPDAYATRKALCLSKLPILSSLSLAGRAKGEGELFPSTAIDVGSAATDRGSSANLRSVSYVCTMVDGNNAANADGSIDTVEIWLVNDASDTTGGGLWFGTFSDGGSNVLTCRDSEGVGACSAGSKQTFTGLDIDVVTGDFIGASHRGTDNCAIERDTTGGTRVWGYIFGDVIDPSDSQTFNAYADNAISLYGTGDTGGDITPPAAQAAIGAGTPTIVREITPAAAAAHAGAGTPTVVVVVIVTPPAAAAVLTASDPRVLLTPAQTPYIGEPYRVEVHNSSGQLVAIPRAVMSGTWTKRLNAADQLSFTIPANDPACAYMTPLYELWVRDLATGDVVSICKPVLDEASE